MAQAVEIVRALFEQSAEWFGASTDRHELERILARYAPDLVYEEAPEWPDAGTFENRDAIIARFLEYADMLQIGRMVVGDVIDAPRAVFAQLHIEMLGEAEGEPIGFVWSYAVRVEDGLVTHLRAYYTPEQARRAAGLTEPAE
jgi:ketosteroid isomerase-like protein